MSLRALPLEIDGAARRPVLNVPAGEWSEWFASRGLPTMHARQVRRWILARGVASFAEMTDLPRPVRAELALAFVPLGGRIAHHAASSDGVHKLLLHFRAAPPDAVECVLIPEGRRRTACISTQVGCGMGCVFCASGLNGVARNLTAGEILEQLLCLRSALAADTPGSPGRLTHVVVMGMGEPLANLDALLAALDVACARDGLGLSARHVTISTVGLPAKMRTLADAGKAYHLAVSLHAPNDELRTRIVPTNRGTGIDAILSAADEFFQKTGRQVTYEYVLLREINDQPRHARELAALLRGRRAHVNLIPFNRVEGLPFRPPTAEALAAFVAPLRAAGISVKVRKRKGGTIDAACGQLRRRLGGEPGA